MFVRALVFFALATPTLQGQTLEDFEDTVWNDGVTWDLTHDGESLFVEVEDGDLVVGASGILSSQGVDAFSVRTRYRSRSITGINLSESSNFAFLWPDGGLGFGGGGPSVSTPLRSGNEDVVLQMDAIGDTVKVWAWAADDPPAVDAAPLLTAPVPNAPADPTEVRLWFTEGSPATRVRYVMYSDQPIPLPEPSGLLLTFAPLLALCAYRKRGRKATTAGRHDAGCRR